jgi:hypothetical protein
MTIEHFMRNYSVPGITAFGYGVKRFKIGKRFQIQENASSSNVSVYWLALLRRFRGFTATQEKVCANIFQ